MGAIIPFIIYFIIGAIGLIFFGVVYALVIFVYMAEFLSLIYKKIKNKIKRKQCTNPIYIIENNM